MSDDAASALAPPSSASRSRPFFERDWVFFALLAAALLLPGLAALAGIGSAVHERASTVWGAIEWFFALGTALWLYQTAATFDPERLPEFPWGWLRLGAWQGYLLKVLAVLHAVAAVILGGKVVGDLTEETPDLRWRLWRELGSAGEGWFLIVALPLLVWLWAVVAVAYLAGDARLRRARRERRP